MKDRPTLHCNRRARMMSEDENLTVVGRFIAPPALPEIIRPRPANWSEHIPPHNPRADVLKATRSKVIIRAGRAAILTEESLLKGSRVPSRMWLEFARRYLRQVEGI